MKPHPVPAILATKKVWVENPATPGLWELMVLQRVAPGLGNVAGVPDADLQLRARVIPTDPQTSAQLAQRSRFAAAQASWYALTQAERDTYTAAARPLLLTGRQHFTRLYIAANPL